MIVSKEIQASLPGLLRKEMARPAGLEPATF
jgi:hypothetical protein